MIHKYMGFTKKLPNFVLCKDKGDNIYLADYPKMDSIRLFPSPCLIFKPRLSLNLQEISKVF